MKRFQDIFRPASLSSQVLDTRRARTQIPSAVLTFVRTATKRAAGSKTSMKDSAGRRLGAKKGDGQLVRVGEIVYRQRGTKIYPGENMGIGRDHTLFAEEPGYVRFYYDPFHPKRKLAGIALGKHDRLPTPHFAPRPRRFGHKLIEDPVKAERERTVMKRKEYLAMPEIEKQIADREARREARRVEFAQKLPEFTSELNDAELQIASQRLVTIQNYLAGGRTVEEARSFTDADYEQDAKLRSELHGDEQALEDLKAYKVIAQKVDAAVSFDPERKLCKAYTLEELDTMAKETLAKVEELTKGQQFMTNEIREQVRLALKQPCFSLSSRLALYRKYTYKPIVLPKLTMEEKEKLVKEGKGKIVLTWNDEMRRVDKVYVPFKNKPQPTVA